MILRDAQLAAFAAAAEESFERRFYVHAAMAYPGLLADRGETGLRDLIRFGAGECQKGGHSTAGDLVQFLDILCEAVCHSGATPAEAAAEAKLTLGARDVFLKLKGLETVEAQANGRAGDRNSP